VIFGIDGATWEIIERLVREDRLPNFGKVMQQGVYGNLRSTNPPVTCPAWACMFTGKSPVTLKVFHFFKPSPDYQLMLSNLNWSKWRPVWDIFSEAGKKVCVFNIPTTTAHPINGYFISGPIWGEQDSVLAYPQELNSELLKLKYSVRSKHTHKVSGDDVFIEDVKNITNRKFEIMFKYYLEYDWDLFILGFYYCDQLSHIYYKDIYKKHPQYSPNSRYKNTLYEHYQLLDEKLGEIIDNLPENASLIIASDHGHEPNHKNVNMNAWLLKNGYQSIKKNYWMKDESSISKGFKHGAIGLFYLLSNSYSKLVYQSGLADRKLLSKLQKKLKGWSFVLENKFNIKHPIQKYIEWGKTTAYCVVFNTIFLNLKGRESRGTVDPEDYEKVRNKIVKDLENFVDPKTNKNIVKQIWTKDELYPRGAPEFFPDLYIQFNEGYRNVFSDLLDPTEVFPPMVAGSTEHALDGIFLAYGPEIDDGKKIEGVNIEDIAPTSLHLAGFAVPKEMDGWVVKEVFNEGSDAASRPVKTEPISSIDKEPKGEKAVIRGLRFSKKI
jgi:predicted AlkP superfamily phosphohydrolase/phosphomutase